MNNAGYAYAEEWKQILISHHIKKSIQNGLKTYTLRLETVKLQEENTRKNIDIGQGNDFLDVTLKAQTTRANIDK